jgi:hypothetical protein
MVTRLDQKLLAQALVGYRTDARFLGQYLLDVGEIMMVTHGRFVTLHFLSASVSSLVADKSTITP